MRAGEAVLGAGFVMGANTVARMSKFHTGGGSDPSRAGRLAHRLTKDQERRAAHANTVGSVVPEARSLVAEEGKIDSTWADGVRLQKLCDPFLGVEGQTNRRPDLLL